MYRKRAFLNPIYTGKPSFIFVVAESSEGGEYVNGEYLITLADCKRMVELEFPLTSSRLRQQSLTKIDLLVEIVNHFRDAVHAEAALIDEQSSK